MKNLHLLIMKKIILIILLLGLSEKSFSQSIWYSQNSGTTSNLNSVNIKYSQLGNSIFVVGDNGIILRTTNNGLIWESINSNTSANLYSINIYYNDTGFAVGANGTIIRTIDGGNSWTQVNSGTSNTLRDIRFVYNPNFKVAAVGEHGTFLKLINDVWVASQIDTVNLNSFKFDPFNNHTTGWIVGNYGTILRTTNAGQNWGRMNTGTINNLNFIDNDYGNIVGDNGTALYINGNTVNFIKSGTQNNLYCVNEYSFLFGACGENGTILRNWNVLFSNNSKRLNSIALLNNDLAWVVGNNGTILFTYKFSWADNAKQLDANSISTWYKNNGIFNKHPFYGSGFQWPKGEYKYARYSSGSLIGAIVNGDTLVTVCDYGSEYLPGYTDNMGIPHGNGNPDYKIYRMIYGVNDSDRIEWPNVLLGNSDQGAPVYFDSSTMSYKPVDYGNQTMFYSYTDSYSRAHTNYAGMTAPLKADVKQINFSFNQPEELKNIIYQEFRIINRSNNQWTNAYINLYSDDDLGFSPDDAEGVDTNIKLAYTYNATDDDFVYGTAPPSVGFVIIRSPINYTGNFNDSVFYCEGKRKRIKIGYKEIGLGSTVIFTDDSRQPHNYRESYNTIRGLQNNGTQYINPTTTQPTKFVYSGDPVTHTGWIYPGPSDARFYQGFGPLNMNTGDTQIIVIAQVIARGSSNLNSITKLREASLIAKEYYDNCFSNVTIGIKNISENIPKKFFLYQNYPNPFNPTTKINYELPITNYVSLKVFDMLGKEVASLVNEKQNAGSYSVDFDGSNLPSGMYFYKLTADNFVSSKKMLLIK